MANGHIQATGIDALGRTQYRYHDQWRTQADRAKFDHMLGFAQVLPGLRASVAELLELLDPQGQARAAAA